MEKNACGHDRALRLLGAAVLAALALGTSGGLRDRDEDIAIWQILTMYAAGEWLVTGLLQWCPCNHALGINTCTRSEWWHRQLIDALRAKTTAR